jgi:Transposase, Mutator family
VTSEWIRTDRSLGLCAVTTWGGPSGAQDVSRTPLAPGCGGPVLSAEVSRRRDQRGDVVHEFDGIHLRIRLDQAKAAVLVVIGVRADGTKELVTMADGYRESSEAWAGLLRDCARRGMRAPVLAVGDGALGSGRPCARPSPSTREQRCWVHKFHVPEPPMGCYDGGRGGSGRGSPGRPSMLDATCSFFWKYTSSDSSVSRSNRDL